MPEDELVCVECGDDLACEGWEQCTECLYNGVEASPRVGLPAQQRGGTVEVGEASIDTGDLRTPVADGASRHA